MYRIFTILMLGVVVSVSGMDFDDCVRQNASDVDSLFSELHKLGDPDSKAFCKCFEGEKDDDKVKKEFESISSKVQQNAVKNAAEYVAGTLYEKVSKSPWTDENALKDLDYAERFSACLKADASPLNGKADQNDGEFLHTMLSNMQKNRRDFLSAFSGLEFKL